eukprot:2799373-Alexandrium_andersonii.AAC.1
MVLRLSGGAFSCDACFVCGGSAGCLPTPGDPEVCPLCLLAAQPECLASHVESWSELPSAVGLRLPPIFQEAPPVGTSS